MQQAFCTLEKVGKGIGESEKVRRWGRTDCGKGLTGGKGSLIDEGRGGKSGWGEGQLRRWERTERETGDGGE